MGFMNLLRWSEWLRRGRWKVVARVSEADEIPATIPAQGAVLVGSRGQAKWLAFDCPCGRGHRILLNLDSAHRPTWTVYDQRGLTVWPSIDSRQAGYRCHFLLDHGRVVWCRDRHGWEEKW